MAAKAKAAKPVVHPPWRSGFCGRDCPPDSHGRCHGFYTHRDGQTSACVCDCHQETDVLPDPFTVPTREEPTPSDQGEKDATPQVSTEEPGDWHQHKTRPWRDGTGLDPIPLVDTITAFAMSAGDLHRISDDPDDYDPRTDALTLLTVLRAGIRRAQEMDALLVAHIYKHGQKGEQLVDGIGRIHVHRRSSKVKWDERTTAKAIVEANLEARQGELPDDPMEAVYWLLDAASIGYYRKTALRALGLDPQDFYTSEKGTLAVDVPIPD